MASFSSQQLQAAISKAKEKNAARSETRAQPAKNLAISLAVSRQVPPRPLDDSDDEAFEDREGPSLLKDDYARYALEKMTLPYNPPNKPDDGKYNLGNNGPILNLSKLAA